MTPLYTSRLRLEFVTAALARVAQHGRAPIEATIGARLHEGWQGEYVFQRSRRVLTDELPMHALIVLEAEALVVGELRFEPLQRGVYEIGYAVGAAFRRRGIALEAVTRLLSWLEEDVGAERVVAGCAMTNRASVRTLRRLGFELDGSTKKGGAFWWSWAPAGQGGY